MFVSSYLFDSISDAKQVQIAIVCDF
jgi:hypothetical protein